MSGYNHSEIEKKWKDKWYETNLYEAKDFSTKPKKYILAEFPYPSGKNLHAGHMMRFTLPDVYSRYLRMKGFNVMFPMGWDAFGLPAENYAVKTGINPAITTKEIIEDYRKSIYTMGYSVDVNREINTTDPKYYKWTQWIFLKFYKAGLAEYKEMPIWWCEKLRTVLSDEEVLTDKDGNKISERGEHPVERKMLKQWVLKIPAYAERLIQGLNDVDFPDAIKNAQTNWIGKSVGMIIDYVIEGTNEKVSVFTTRPDTNFGATFVVLAPEHPLALKITTQENLEAVKSYIEKTSKKSELERLTEVKDKTGVFTGSYAINGLNGEKLPIYLADYALLNFGTGAVVGVPGHDKRDFLFAQKFALPVKRVVVGKDGDASEITSLAQVQEDEGKIINSDFLDGMEINNAIDKICDHIIKKGCGERHTTYRIRDWVFSRQRYWGEPIPVIHKEDGTIEPLCDPDEPIEVKNSLPLILPDVPDFNPTPDGLSPLEKNVEWLNVKDKNGKPARRETNTMPNWAGSSWYYIRYCDPANDSEFANFDILKYWLPVDKYFGGAEHTTMHLLYSRFWHQFLFDNKLVPTPEPYAWRINGGLLLGPDGKKMSKSKGNVVEPVEKFGADALRMFICFLGPYEDTYPWNDNGMKATSKLLITVYGLKSKVNKDVKDSEEVLKAYNIMVKNVTGMFENLKMNTAVSELMIFVNNIKNVETIGIDVWKGFIKVLAPMAPFIAEELWQEINGNAAWTVENSVHVQSWPTFDEKLTTEDVITLAIQINGKVRSQIKVPADIKEEELRKLAVEDPKIANHLAGKEIRKFIYIPGKIISIVV
jgi:leucyl-tRNA synthetase